jgi:hypothetical protein
MQTFRNIPQIHALKGKSLEIRALFSRFANKVEIRAAVICCQSYIFSDFCLDAVACIRVRMSRLPSNLILSEFGFLRAPVEFVWTLQVGAGSPIVAERNHHRVSYCNYQFIATQLLTHTFCHLSEAFDFL